MSKIYFDEDDDRRIEFNRLMHNSHDKDGYSFGEGEFRRYIFMLGLLDFEGRILPKMTGKPYKPYYFIQGEEVLCRCEPVGETT